MERDAYFDWRLKGPCSSLSPSDYDALFFPSAGRSIIKAQQFCNSCPVRAQCLQLALDTDAKGVWAGTTEKERRGMRRFLSSVVPKAVNIRKAKRIGPVVFT